MSISTVKWRNAICVVASVIMLSASVNIAAAAEKRNLAIAYGATSIHAEGDVVFAEALAKAINNEIIVPVHTGGGVVVDTGTDAVLDDLAKAGQDILEAWLVKTGERGANVIAAFRAKMVDSKA